MKKVDAPKVRRRAVDSLSEEDARRFFEDLNALDFDFRCILQLLITTGVRHGECIGLQWQDVDFDNRIIIGFWLSRHCTRSSAFFFVIPRQEEKRKVVIMIEFLKGLCYTILATQFNNGASVKDVFLPSVKTHPPFWHPLGLLE